MPDASGRALPLVLFFFFTIGCAAGKSEQSPPAVETEQKPAFGGGIAGVVLDGRSEAPISGAFVLAVSGAKPGVTVSTEEDGQFWFPELAPGAYDLMVQKEGFRTLWQTNLGVRSGEDLTVNVRMAPGTATKGISAPRFLSGPNPRYTQQALAHGTQGTMVVRCLITVEGAVRDCRVLRPIEYMNAAVVAALEARRYQPAMLDGKPVEVLYTFNIELRTN